MVSVGLIPARAGNIGAVPSRCGGPRAHPRSRGEHSYTGLSVVGDGGSSPLARGTCAHAVGGGCRFGLIPARAGNIALCCAQGSDYRAHPRSRGEHPMPAPPGVRRSGSSPLARGTCNTFLKLVDWTGLIPARAGNMSLPVPVPEIIWAHPRSRGEHIPLCRFR